MDTLFLLDRARLAALAIEHRDTYQTSQPFAHVVFDSFLPAGVLDEVLEEFPTPATPGWFRFDSPLERKLASVGDGVLGPATRHLLNELNSAAMLDFLRDLTGIHGLVPDPHYVGGGLHQIESGGFLEVHADFNLHPSTRLYRRLNLLLYLNHDWQPSWGGALELWDQATHQPRARHLPVFNRCVIFSTTDRALHGHPDPVAAPDGTTRKSLALYYYTRDPDPTDQLSNPHATRFEPNDDGLAAHAEMLQMRDAPSAGRWVIRQLVPPAVLTGRRWLRARLRQRSRPGGHG